MTLAYAKTIPSAMARAIWIGELAFGRVRIPVRLEPIVRQKTVRAHLVHREDQGRLQQRRFCKKCQKEVAWEDTARAVEIGHQEVVDFEPTELQELLLEREEEIAITGFSDPASVDPAFFNRNYAVVPIGKQPRAFEVLAAAMQKSGKIAITEVVLSRKSHPAIIRVRGPELVLSTLHFGDEVEVPARSEPLLRPSPKEISLGEKLIEKMSMGFDPKTTEDPYRLAVEEIAAGRPSRPIDEQAARRKRLEADAELMDLMSALQESLGEEGEAQTKEERTQRARAARPGLRKTRARKPRPAAPSGE